MVKQSKSKMSLSKIDSEIDEIEQEKYLRQATQHFRGLEKPLKNGPAVESLGDLIAALHREFATNYVNIEMVNHLMLSYKSNPAEWRKYAKFDRYTYTRNLVDEGNGRFNLLILCWGEGTSSTVHDHSDSHCFMKMLKGDLTEKRYEYPNRDPNTEESLNESNLADRQLVEIGETPISLNNVAYINDNLGLHRVENPSHSETSVSLHLYCPPFDTCSVFHNSSKKTTAKVTFWSKYGVRTKLEGQ